MQRDPCDTEVRARYFGKSPAQSRRFKHLYSRRSPSSVANLPLAKVEVNISDGARLVLLTPVLCGNVPDVESKVRSGAMPHGHGHGDNLTMNSQRATIMRCAGRSEAAANKPMSRDRENIGLPHRADADIQMATSTQRSIRAQGIGHMPVNLVSSLEPCTVRCFSARSSGRFIRAQRRSLAQSDGRPERAGACVGISYMTCTSGPWQYSTLPRSDEDRASQRRYQSRRYHGWLPESMPESSRAHGVLVFVVVDLWTLWYSIG